MRLAFGLASVQEGESVLDAIERLTGTDARVVLPDEQGDDSPIVRVPGAESEDRAADDSRYQIVGEIARGGVGVVFKGRDRDLGRDVAIKVLRKDLTSSPEVIQRFIEEAQIEGQLQHPGIVPVYGLGVQPDGRPYFAMKLIKGDTLAAVLKARRDAAEDRRRLLKLFEQVCQTVAYAHARRVIHRDLKPANVIIGGFGQVQVVDWGFAKVLARGGVADEVPEEEPVEPDVSMIETVRSGPGSSGSVAGSVMGTPAYMPPEQALGQPERVNETSDVFSLGAILTEILTGKPPYTGADTREILLKAARAKTEEAFDRLDGCSADAMLIELAKHCLSPAQKARPRDAAEVAAAVEDYLTSVEERARKAEMDAVAERTKAVEERRRRKLTLALAATVLVAVLGAGGTFWWMDAKAKERTRDANAAVSVALQEVITLRGEARAGGVEDLTKWSPAIAEAEAAARLAESGEADESSVRESRDLLASLQAEAEAARDDAEHTERLAAMERRIAEIRSRRGSEFPKEERAADLLAALKDLGIDLDELAAEEAGARIRESELASELVAAIDYQYIYLADDRFRDVLPHADPDPWRNRVRTLHREGDRSSLVALARGPDLSRRPLQSILLLGDALVQLDLKASLVAYRAAEENAADEFWVSHTLGYRLIGLRRPDLALPRLRTAADRRADLCAPRYQLGFAYALRGDQESSARLFREVYRQLPEYGNVRTCLAAAVNNIGLQASKMGSTDTAIARYKEALELNPESLDTPWNLAFEYSKAKRYEEARETLLEIIERDPDRAYKHSLDVHLKLAHTHLCLWQPEQAIAVLQRLENLTPPALKLARAKRYHGQALVSLGRLGEAKAIYEKAQELSPSNHDVTWRLAELALIEGDAERAADYSMQIPLSPSFFLTPADTLRVRALRLAGRSPKAADIVDGNVERALREFTNPLEQANLYAYLGNLLAWQYLLRDEMPREDELRKKLERILTAKMKLGGAGAAADMSRIADVRLATILYAIAAKMALHLGPGETDDLVARVLELHPRLELAIMARLAMLAKEGRYAEAEAAARARLEGNPGDMASLRMHGAALLLLGRLDEAVARSREAMAACMQKCRLCRDALLVAENCVDASTRLEEIRAKPEDPADLYWAAQACYHLGRHEDAVELFARARRSGPPPLASALDFPHRSLTIFRQLEAMAAVALAAETSAERAAAARRQALDVLKDQLETCRDLSRLPSLDMSASPALGNTLNLLHNGGFASVREEEHLSKLPPEEATEWRAFWKEVRELWEWIR